MPKPLLPLLLLALAACQSTPVPPTVQRVDLNRYAGTWYEIARLPVWFENGCVGVTAQYTTRPNGKVTVLNASYLRSLDGQRKSITGTARVTDPPANTKLKVMFFWPFEGDYWILRLDPDYRWAAVGSPDRDTLWILSRTPTLDDTLYNSIIASLKTDGFPVDQLEKTPQK